MAKLPAAQIRIGKGVNGQPLGPAYDESCAAPDCFERAAHFHHIVRRSFLGGPFSRVEIDGLEWPNVLPLCFTHHERLERNEARIVLPEKNEDRPYTYLWQEGEWFVPLETAPGLASLPSGGSLERGLTEGEGASGHMEPRELAASPSVSPGEKCEGCGRKMPHPRTPKSPTSKVASFRMPSDVYEEFIEIEESVLAHIGAEKEPFAKYKAILSGYIVLLQGPGQERAA